VPFVLDPGMPLVPELVVFGLAVAVLLLGLVQHPAALAHDVRSARRVGWLTLVGLLVALGLTYRAEEGRTLLGGAFAQDGLALFVKRLLISSGAVSVLASLTVVHPSFVRRGAEYHFALVVSLLGMSILASAREWWMVLAGRKAAVVHEAPYVESQLAGAQ